MFYFHFHVGEYLWSFILIASSLFCLKHSDAILLFTGESKIISMSDSTYSSGMAAVPDFPQVIPYNVTYVWQPASVEVNLTVVFHAIKRGRRDNLELRTGDGDVLNIYS